MTALLSLGQAAEAIGYTVKGFRKIVDRSRAKSRGARTRGPTIKFFQTSKGAPIKFRPEWIEEFIDQHASDPDSPVVTERPAKRRKTAQRCVLTPPEDVFGLDGSLMGGS